MSVCLISLPLSIVLASILPYLLAVTVFHAIKEITCVNGAVAKSNRSISLSLVVVHHLSSNTVVVCSHWATLKVIDCALGHHLLRNHHVAILSLQIIAMIIDTFIEVSVWLKLVEGTEAILIIIQHLTSTFEIVGFIIWLNRKLLIIHLGWRLTLRIIIIIMHLTSHIAHHVLVLLQCLFDVVLGDGLSVAVSVRLRIFVCACWLSSHA